MKIGIVGAGVGGLTLALSLIDKGYRDIQIYEAAEEISDLGVGINILPHAMQVMSGLGLLAPLVAASVETGTLSITPNWGRLIL